MCCKLLDENIIAMTYDNYHNLRVEKEETLLHVVIDASKRLNALNSTTLSELDDVFSKLSQEKEIRAVLVSGAGEKAFVAGADIREFSSLDAKQGQAFAQRGQQIFQKIEDLNKPVLAAVQGYALGGGCELAMACHLRLASEKAVFGQPEINLGTLPGYGGTQRLPRLVGRTKAMHWLLTGDMISAQEALSSGLVHAVVPQEKLLEESKKLLKKLTSKAPLALRALLECLRTSDAGEEGYGREAQAFGRLCTTEDFKEGAEAFLQKRPPSFKGR